MDTIEKYLFDSTGMEWDLVLPIVMHFKTHYGPMRRLCVYSPDNPSNPFARYYIPKDADPLTLASPDDFLTKCLNVKKKLVDNPPTVKINLDSLPEITIIRPGSAGFTLTYTIGYTGELVLKKTTSLSTLELELISGLSLSSHIDFSAKGAATDFIAEIKPFPDLADGKFKLESSYTDSLCTSSLIWNGTTFTAEFIPQPKLKKIIFYGWEISGSIGYKVSGSMNPEDGSKAPPLTAFDPEIVDVSAYRKLVDKLSSLVIYTNDDNDGDLSAPLTLPLTTLFAP